MEIFIPLIIGIGLYSFMGWMTTDLIEGDINKITAVRARHGYPRCIELYLYFNKANIIKICAMLWPLYIFYRIGVICGKNIYEKKLEYNDENRIATWFI